MSDLNWNNITTTTRDHIIPKLRDNIFTSNVLMHRLLRNSKPATGKRILEPLIYAKGIDGFYNEYDLFTIEPKEKLTNAEFEWKQAYATMVISGLDEEVKNVGPEKIFSLIKTEAQIAEKTLKDTFGTTFFKTTSAGSKEFGTIYDYVINTTGTVGAIDASTHSWWQSKSRDAGLLYGNSGPTRPTWSEIVTATNRDFLPTMMRDLWAAVSEDSDVPTIIITTQLIYDAYETTLSSQKRFMGSASQGLADAGFQNLSFRGKPVVYDSHVPAGYMFMLNEKYLQFRHSPNRNFKMEPWQKPVNQDVRIAKILWAGNVTVSNRRFQGVLYNLPIEV